MAMDAGSPSSQRLIVLIHWRWRKRLREFWKVFVNINSRYRKDDFDLFAYTVCNYC